MLSERSKSKRIIVAQQSWADENSTPGTNKFWCNVCCAWKKYWFHTCRFAVELGRNCGQRLWVERSNQRMSNICELIENICVGRLLDPFSGLAIDQLYATHVLQVLE